MFLEEECTIKALSAKARRSSDQACVGDGFGEGGKIFKKLVKCILFLEFN